MPQTKSKEGWGEREREGEMSDTIYDRWEMWGDRKQRVFVCARAHVLGEMGVQEREESVAPSDMEQRCKRRNVRAVVVGEVVTSSFDLRLGEGKGRGWRRDGGGCDSGKRDLWERGVSWRLNGNLTELRSVKFEMSKRCEERWRDFRLQIAAVVALQESSVKTSRQGGLLRSLFVTRGQFALNTTATQVAWNAAATEPTSRRHIFN